MSLGGTPLFAPLGFINPELSGASNSLTEECSYVLQVENLPLDAGFF